MLGSSWRISLWLALVVVAACAGFQCDTPPKTPPAATRPKPDVRLFVLTDPKGYLEPCGCQQRPLGGLDKLATKLEKGRADGVPTLLLAAGDLTYGVELRPEDAAVAKNQEHWRADTLVQVWSELGMTAATPGPLDFAQGAEEQQSLIAQSKFPWLVENVVDGEGKPLPGVSKGKLVDAGAIKVGLFGVMAPNPALRLPQGAALDADLSGVAKRANETLRAQGAKLVVALVDGDRRSAREVASSGVDVVVMGGADLEEPLPPSVVGSAVVVHAGRQGQRLLTLDLELDAQGTWKDTSDWTRNAARKDLEAQVKELAAKVQSWEKDPKVAATDLGQQRERLAAMKAELASEDPLSFEGRWFDAKVEDLDPEVPGEKSIAARLDAYDRKVNEANGKVHVPPVPAPEGAPTYVGSESCKSCHEAAYAWWRTTKHGHAYQTLVDRHKEFDLSCVGCHVVGYNKPGGSTVTAVENLKDVGCENCHGPGSKHNAEPEKAGFVMRDTPEAVCAGCHNHEHSPRFVYDAFRSLLIVPGHGKPLANADPPKTH